jgi:hypothetical protein
MRRAALFAALMLAAPSALGARRVVVLDTSARSDFAWPSGQRAVVAELMASDAELVIRPALAGNASALEREVFEAAGEPDTVGAVGVGREGSVGIALVALHAGRSPVRIEDDVAQGPVADGAVALRVSEVLKVRSFELPPAAEPHRAPPPPREAHLALWPWVAFGVAATRGASSAAPAVALGLRVPIAPWLALEPAGALTLGGLRVDTSAGDVALAARQATLDFVIAPADHEGLSPGVAAGGGIAWISGQPRAESGYHGTESSTQVSVFGMRAFGAWQRKSLRLLAFVEASLFVPAVTVTVSGDGSELARLGQPWLMSGVAIGYGP